MHGQHEPSTLDAPWLRQQVETHLVFGFLARHLPFAWVLAFGTALAVVFVLSRGATLQAIELALCIALCLFFLRRMSKYRQAALGWWIIKVTAALCSFLLLIVGGLVGFLRARPDAIYVTALALVWFPGPEFVPIIGKRQRFVTLARIAVSVPLIYLGSQVGNWTWR
jgi:hypothetical protein